jgi:putative membrane protein
MVYLSVLSVALATIAWGPTPAVPGGIWEIGLLGVFLIPGVGATAFTGPLAAALGGRFSVSRSALLALMASGFALPILLLWRSVGLVLAPGVLPALPDVLLFGQAPVLWFRHMSLFGMSNPRHGRTLPASLVQPALSSVGVLAIYGATEPLLAETGLFLVIGFLCSALLLRSADRPLKREFGVSGVALIRPLLDHINDRDPAGTQVLERFFSKFAIPADLRITLLALRTDDTVRATIALPTVHPGPFAALGASDLPRKLAEHLGDAGGVVFVPHTPCNHDLDLPSRAEVDRIGTETARLLGSLPRPEIRRASPLLSPRPGALARAQVLDDAAIVVASQAPRPTDDIAYAVVDRLYGVRWEAGGGPVLALVDAHNSYKEEEGDLNYGSPEARALVADAEAAVRLALERAVPGPFRAGVAVRRSYTVAKHGIGPQGIQALAIEAAGTKTAYVLIDGNNLLQGLRAPLLEGIADLVDAAEIMTTDNHVVHEVDGGINPVGERYPLDALRADVRAVVAEALAGLSPAEMRAASREIPSVQVLGPAWTARLLTSLGDTLAMFANAFVSTFLLLITSGLAILALLR